MPPIRGWFKARKTLPNRRRTYYEDIYGYKNPEEDLEGVYILDSESDSESEILSRSARRQGRHKARLAHRNDKEQAMEGMDDNETGAPTVDRSTVITIDDSDVEEPFVADLRRYAVQDIQESGIHDKVDEAFLAEVKRYAAEPPRPSNDPSDEILVEIDQRAGQSADQSPLGSMLNAQTIMQTTESPADRPSEELLEGSTNTEAPDDETIDEGTRQSVEVVQRAYSWDPSQDSDYTYSEDEKASDGPININNNSDQDMDLDDADTGDAALSNQDPAKENVAKRPREEEQQTSEDHDSDHGMFEPDQVEDTSDSSGEPNLGGTQNERSEPNKALTYRKSRRFGMFAAPDVDAATVVDSDDTTPPQRLRDLFRKRRQQRGQKGSPKKKDRYNLRPRRQPAGDLHERSLVARSFVEADESDTGIETEDEEPRRPHRMTRSGTVHKQAKKIIPRSRAARKTAWVLRRTPTGDERPEKNLSRQVVEVVIPAVHGSRRTGPEESVGRRQALDMILID